MNGHTVIPDNKYDPSYQLEFIPYNSAGLKTLLFDSGSSTSPIQKDLLKTLKEGLNLKKENKESDVTVLVKRTKKGELSDKTLKKHVENPKKNYNCVVAVLKDPKGEQRLAGLSLRNQDKEIYQWTKETMPIEHTFQLALQEVDNSSAASDKCDYYTMYTMRINSPIEKMRSFFKDKGEDVISNFTKLKQSIPKSPVFEKAIASLDSFEYLFLNENPSEEDIKAALQKIKDELNPFAMALGIRVFLAGLITAIFTALGWVIGGMVGTVVAPGPGTVAVAAIVAEVSRNVGAAVGLAAGTLTARGFFAKTPEPECVADGRKLVAEGRQALALKNKK